jgi:hypothetical protein
LTLPGDKRLTILEFARPAPLDVVFRASQKYR